MLPVWSLAVIVTEFAPCTRDTPVAVNVWFVTVAFIPLTFTVAELSSMVPVTVMELVPTVLLFVGEDTEITGGVVSRVIVMETVELLPTLSVAIIVMAFCPSVRATFDAVNIPFATGANVPFTFTVELASSIVPEMVIVVVFTVLPFNGEVILTTGAVVSE